MKILCIDKNINRLKEKLLGLTEEEKKNLFNFMSESIDFDYTRY